jgi:hypothetical protein
MILSRLFLLAIGVLIVFLLIPVLIIGGLMLLLAFALLPFLIPSVLIIIGGLVILVGLACALR